MSTKLLPKEQRDTALDTADSFAAVVGVELGPFRERGTSMSAPTRARPFVVRYSLIMDNPFCLEILADRLFLATQKPVIL